MSAPDGFGAAHASLFERTRHRLQQGRCDPHVAVNVATTLAGEAALRARFEQALRDLVAAVEELQNAPADARQDRLDAALATAKAVLP